MSWISGPCRDGHDEAFTVEPECNVVPERDDVVLREIADQGTHFALNQRRYPGRPRGTASDATKEPPRSE